MRRRAVLAAATLLVAACSRKRQPRFDYGEPKKQYQLKGIILRLRPADRIAVVRHEKIGDWMEAMTMEFPVPSAEEFARLKEGAPIRATVNVNDEYYWLTGITVE